MRSPSIKWPLITSDLCAPCSSFNLLELPAWISEMPLVALGLGYTPLTELPTSLHGLDTLRFVNLLRTGHTEPKR